jgi:signal transduction histidine kinase
MCGALISEIPKTCEDCKPFVRILIIEDEQKLATALRQGLEGEQYTVSVAYKHGTVMATIKDSGPGIAPEHQEKVFDRFYRFDPGRTRSAGGAGLGLAIAKWVVQAHGGAIHQKNADEGGSIFTLHLPLARTGSPAPHPH